MEEKKPAVSFLGAWRIHQRLQKLMAASPVFEFANNIKIGTIVKNVITVRQSLYSKVLSSLKYVTAMLTAMDLCTS